MTADLDHLFRIAEAPFTRGPNARGAGSAPKTARRLLPDAAAPDGGAVGPRPKLRTCLQPEAGLGHVGATVYAAATAVLRVRGIPTSLILLLPARPGSHATLRPRSTLAGAPGKSIMMVVGINKIGWVPAVCTVRRGRAAHVHGGRGTLTSAVGAPAMPQSQRRLPASRVLPPWAGAFRVPTYG